MVDAILSIAYQDLLIANYKAILLLMRSLMKICMPISPMKKTVSRMATLSKRIRLQIVGIFACKHFCTFFMKMNCLVKMHPGVHFRITSGCKGYVWTTEKWPKETAKGCWLKTQFQLASSNEQIIFGNVFNVISNRK